MGEERALALAPSSMLTVDTARLRAILDTVVDGILTIGADGIVLSANPAVTSIFGYDVDELIGHNVSILMPSPDRERHDDYLAAYLATGEAKIIGKGREVTGRRKDGSTFPLYLAVSHSIVNDVPMFTGIVRDITEVKALENSLRAANAAKSDFLSSMSHELRTPLNAILGFGQLMVEDERAPLSPDHRNYMENILEAGRHLLSLINDVLDLSRIESGVMEVVPANIMVDTVLDECVSLIRPVSEKRGIALTCTILSDEPLGVRADFVRLKQVLLNLLSNAVKYNSETDGKIDITVATSGPNIRFSVANTGPGIAENFQHSVFERFNRLDQSQSSIAGTGIGLSISRQLVELMNGSIGFVSTPSERTTFWIDLPQADVPATIKTHAEKDAAYKVLYIDDNPSNVKLMENMIDFAGEFAVISAHDTQWARDIADVWKPDVIILDLENNPGALNMCTDLAEQSIPIIGISDDARSLRDDVQGPCFSVLTRPVRPADIRKALRAAVTLPPT